MKYKLIKTYPGSPPLGTVTSTFKIWTKIHSDIEIFETICVPISDYPEYWQKIDEIPEYVRLIKNSVWKIKKGTVCKVVKENKRASDQWVLENVYFPNDQNNPENHNWFFVMKSICKPATKEEYEAQENQLIVPVGTLFVHHCNKSIIYKIQDIYNRKVTITWGKDKIEDVFITFANSYFKNKIWIPVEFVEKPL